MAAARSTLLGKTVFYGELCIAIVLVGCSGLDHQSVGGSEGLLGEAGFPSPLPDTQSTAEASSTPPQITAISASSRIMTVVDQDQWSVSFQDAGRDVLWIRFEEYTTSRWAVTGAFDPHVSGMSAGQFTVATICKKPGVVLSRMYLRDAAGRTGDAFYYVLNCLTETPRESSTHQATNTAGASGLAWNVRPQ